MGTYEKLRRALDAIPFVDDHSHVLHHNIEPAPWEGPYEVLPLSRLLLDFNTRGCWSLSEKQINDVLLGHLSPETQKQLLTAPHTKNKSTYRFLIRGLREMYGMDIWDINESNWDAVNAALTGSRDDFYGLLEKAFTLGNVKCSVLNMWSQKCYPYLTEYLQRLTDREKALDKQFFVFSTTLDCHAMEPFGPVTANYARDFGMKLDTLADYEALLEEICRWSVEEKGVRAFKNTEMYFRRLDYKLRTYEEAAACYKPQRTAEEEKILSDYIACIVFRMAGKLNVPVQIHTGSIWGDFNMPNISPEHLATVLTAFPNTKFDLLHGGDPFYGTMALMGAGFANVYVNMSTMPNTSYDDFKHWLRVFLDRVPSSKISLGWDEFAPEMVVGDAIYTRDVVAAVLAEKIDNGQYSYDLALEIAHDIMHRTAEALFQIP